MELAELRPPYRGFSTAFNEAIRALDPEPRDAFITTEIRGLTVREAAAALGRSRSDIDRLAQRARLTVKENLT